ncbi:MAG: bifunctional sulfate adenylyltransferase/adenylylsulfate kinase [Desulfobacteraceae bacterium]|jgi:sulfate adenylyltransferase
MILKAHSEETNNGKLINLIVDSKRAEVLKQIAMNLPDITLNDHQLCDLELLAVGAFSPLEGFLVRSDYEAVLDRMSLQDNTLWPIPICLDVSETSIRNLEAGQSVALRDPEGFLLAILHVEDIWQANKEAEAEKVYGTLDKTHPGVHYLMHTAGEYYIGGKLEVISPPLHFDFKQLRLSPAEIRKLYKKLGWQRVVGFQSRNVIHRPQYEMTLEAMRQAKANLLLLPVVGQTLAGDFDYYTRVRCYREMAKHYPPESHLVTLLPSFMRLAGPREAVLNTIVAKNYGCTHFVIGHEHAEPGDKGQGKVFYDSVQTQAFAKEVSERIGVSIISFDEMVYLSFEDEYRPKSTVKEGTQTISLSGSEIRNRIKTGRRIPDWASFPKVLDELRNAYPPPRRQGFTLFLTGLSGAGKSTIARVLYSKVLEIGDRPVTLLDGDIVRRNLSSELNFSKEHRDINVRRIGFVASEITKNRGIAICAPIAPYHSTRREIRTAIEEYGGFIEIHVATPIDECEKRDRKGMYAKARAGMIKGFTGVDDPYEIPEAPELRIDTSNITPDEAAQEILLFLGRKGYI